MAAYAGGPYTGRGSFRLSWYGARIAGQIDAAVQRAMDETAAAAKAEAQSRARVDTGAMRDSIDAVVSTTGAGRRRMVLSIGVPYGIFNELGTSRMSAQPMLRPAIDLEAPRLRERIRAALGSGR
jgi:HK97 gp10 family phage protein